MTNLKKIRKANGIKAAELARMLKQTRQSVFLAEKKGVRNLKTAKKYAAFLGCDWRELLDD